MTKRSRAIAQEIAEQERSMDAVNRGFEELQRKSQRQLEVFLKNKKAVSHAVSQVLWKQSKTIQQHEQCEEAGKLVATFFKHLLTCEPPTRREWLKNLMEAADQ